MVLACLFLGSPHILMRETVQPGAAFSRSLCESEGRKRADPCRLLRRGCNIVSLKYESFFQGVIWDPGLGFRGSVRLKYIEYGFGIL